MAFYCFLGLFLGNGVAQTTLITVFSLLVTNHSFSISISLSLSLSLSLALALDLNHFFIFLFQVLAVMFLFIRCTAIDPSDKTHIKNKKSKTRSKSNIGLLNLNYGSILGQIIKRFIRRIERRILKAFIRRKYLDSCQNISSGQIEPLLPFPLVMKEKDDAIPPNPREDDISFCPLCDFEVRFTTIWVY